MKRDFSKCHRRRIRSKSDVFASDAQTANETLLHKNEELAEYVKTLLDHRKRFDEMKQVLDKFIVESTQ